MREFSLLQHVYKSNRSLGRRVLIPPGDDMAMVALAAAETKAGGSVLAAVDQLVAERHYEPRVTPVELVGRKAVARSLSDIAAMAARPLCTLAAVTLPPEYGEVNATRLFDAMRRTAEQFDCPLVGGDIAFHPRERLPLVCSITVLAEPIDERHPPVPRSGARPGDAVYITGTVGGSLGADGLGRHLTFDPRINEAIELRLSLGGRLHAMVDVSDGLGRDLAHLIEGMDLVIEIDVDSLPVSPGCPWRQALSDGEDYELCFTASGDVPIRLGNVPVTRIGRVVRAGPSQRGRVIAVTPAGERVDVTTAGWEHANDQDSGGAACQTEHERT